MDFKKHLSKYNLTPDNCVVIGSGIMDAKGIRDSHDIDVVIKTDVYNKLKELEEFTVSDVHGREIIVDNEEIVEAGDSWIVLGKERFYDDLVKDSEIIDGVRFVTLDFLHRVKKSWTENDESPREKDFKDIELIESYLSKQSNK